MCLIQQLHSAPNTAHVRNLGINIAHLRRRPSLTFPKSYRQLKCSGQLDAMDTGADSQRRANLPRFLGVAEHKPFTCFGRYLISKGSAVSVSTKYTSYLLAPSVTNA